MKNPLFLGALCACTFGLICASAMAQPLPARNTAPAPAAQTEAKTKTGYDLFLEARTLLKEGPNGASLTGKESPPAENLRLQREGTARNAAALAKLREALKAYIVFPDQNFATPEMALTAFDSNAVVRQFARYLAQEAAVRAADGDAASASQSSLDALELSTQVARGPIIQALVGAATQAIARRSLEQNAGGLNATQLREVADRWQRISDNFPTYAQTLRGEEQIQSDLLYQSYAAAIVAVNDPVAIKQVETEFQQARVAGKVTPEEAKEFEASVAPFKGVTFGDILTKKRVIFDEALTRANQPYFLAKSAAPLGASDPINASTAELISSAQTRFYAERNLVGNRQLVAALRLRAAKLETGAYPQTFDAGADPFSPDLAPLKYKRAGDAYVLYSVGPDGKDDDGAPIQTVVTDDETGSKTVRDHLAFDSTGDILSPVL